MLIVAAAKPQRTVAVPVERAAIMLATDVKPSRLVAARRAARNFVNGVPRGVNIGVMAFNGRPRVLQSPTPERADIETALNRLTPSGGTATGDALQAALNALKRADRKGGDDTPPAAIVLLSDGESTKGRDPIAVAQAAKKAGIPVYTVALGTENGTIPTPDGGTQRVPPDRATMRQVAAITGGRAYTAADGDKLSAVYEKLGSEVGTKDEKRELTAAFAGGALVLLALGGASALRWFGRLP